MRRAIDRYPSLFLILALLMIWQVTFWMVGRNALLPPAETVLHLIQLLQTARFWGHIAETGAAFLIALSIAIVAGLAIGIALGMNRTAAEVFEPFLLAGNSIPKIALYPIVLLIFGIGMPAKIAFGAIHGVVPVAIFTLTACTNIPPILVRAASAMRLTRWDTVRSVLLPAALPDIFSGIRIGFSLTLIGTILGEMFGSQRGLGYLLMTAIGLQNIQVIMSVTLLLVFVAATVNSLLLMQDRRLRNPAG
ncbi:MAG TPA: ABC transporter permease subunit [Bradyrhizobium sp.]|uniref:ABC transporter permease n=1 Tax=Bradyrhizobium sp. TaxID=376 RepID=UPI002D7ECEEA|nr:ABC transporter permease subunit [Bradyrhizobium sp.]HET7886796.1 ABC transporter permease subunit [Bradyrhizobium sp.]